MIDKDLMTDLLIEYEVRPIEAGEIYGPFDTDEWFGEENMDLLAGPITGFLGNTVEQTHDFGCEDDLSLVMAGFLQGLAIGWRYNDESA